MNSSPSKTDIIRRLSDTGACAVGFARAAEVDPADMERFEAYLCAGHHAEMEYLTSNMDLRRDPRTLLDDARTVIVCAFCYRRKEPHPLVADYALSEDYHRVLPRAIYQALDGIDGGFRVCVDSAPVLERYWAVRSGIGFIGRNHCLIVPGVGSKVLLAVILTTIELAPDTPYQGQCYGCDRCLRACPAGALGRDSLDCRRCLSYLTIEHRGPLPEGTRLPGRVVGCDICQDVCPHNRAEVYAPDILAPMPKIMAARTPDALATVSLRNTALARAGRTNLLRNLAVH